MTYSTKQRCLFKLLLILIVLIMHLVDLLPYHKYLLKSNSNRISYLEVIWPFLLA